MREGSFTYKDPRLGTLPPRRWDLYLPSSPDLKYGPLRDPKMNVEYPFRLQVRCMGVDSSGEDRVDRRFVIHYLKPEDEGMARQIGGVMARLYWIVSDYLGREVKPYVNVWINHEGKAGAEEYRGNILVYALDEPRAPAEWVRELAHEYGHLTLPNMGPFTEPEKYASGYLGERLFLKWMLYDNAQADAWDQPVSGAAYMANQVVPLRNRYLDAGPGAAASEKTDTAGMDFFIGQMLTIEAAQGPAFLRQVLNRFTTPRPQNLGLYLTTTIQELKPGVQFFVDPAAYIPARSQVEEAASSQAGLRLKKASYWVFLPGGDWQIDVEGVLPPGTTAASEGLQFKKANPSLPGALAWETNIGTANGLWRRLDLAPPAGQVMELKRILVSRKDALRAGPVTVKPGGGQPGTVPPGGVKRRKGGTEPPTPGQ
jgi:hypothetical protein